MNKQGSIPQTKMSNLQGLPNVNRQRIMGSGMMNQTPLTNMQRMQRSGVGNFDLSGFGMFNLQGKYNMSPRAMQQRMSPRSMQQRMSPKKSPSTSKV